MRSFSNTSLHQFRYISGLIDFLFIVQENHRIGGFSKRGSLLDIGLPSEDIQRDFAVGSGLGEADQSLLVL